MNNQSSQKPACHICSAPGLNLITGYEQLTRVTSDCKVWPAGGKLGICPQCSTAQAVLDERWHKEADTIYSSYTIYHQAEGAEQNVFDPVTGAPASRSSVLARFLDQASILPKQGRMMDYGCGNGSFLKSFGPVFRGWKMCGLELNPGRRQEIESIPGVEKFFTPPLEKVAGVFDLISVIHCLEHIPSPLQFLREIREKLTPAGLVMIEVPDCAANPFSLLIADHSTHFCWETLAALVQNAGFEIIETGTQPVAKELTLLARRTESQLRSKEIPPPRLDLAALKSGIAWLEQLRDDAKRHSAQKPFGLFGSSIAATFLAGELRDGVEFFVDEDPSRAGKTMCGRPIYAPPQIPAGAHVYVGLPPVVAGRIADRMGRMNLPAHFHSPPPLPSPART